MPKNKPKTCSLAAISEPTLRRIPIYYEYLKMNHDNIKLNISTSEIARDLHLKPIQVRKDLQMTGVTGKPKVGYVIKEVLAAIEGCLGYNHMKEAFLIGAGNLGQALLGYEGFNEYGLTIVAAFDSNPKKAGCINGKCIYEIASFKEMALRLNIQLGIITTPAEYAQEVCDIMVDAGIKGIWNFAPTHLNVPQEVIVQNEHMTASLAVLAKRLAQK